MYDRSRLEGHTLSYSLENREESISGLLVDWLFIIDSFLSPLHGLSSVRA